MKIMTTQEFQEAEIREEKRRRQILKKIKARLKAGDWMLIAHRIPGDPDQILVQKHDTYASHDNWKTFEHYHHRNTYEWISDWFIYRPEQVKWVKAENLLKYLL